MFPPRLSLPAFVIGLVSAFAAEAKGDDRQDFFERRIRPVLVERCYGCHSGPAGKLKGGLRLDHADGLARGGESGAVVTPGEPDKSLLWQAISYSGGASEMPPDGKLPAQTLDDFRQWIAQGAYYPKGRGEGAEPGSATPRRVDIAAGRSFWSFRPLRAPALPPVADPTLPLQPLDSFVLAELDQRRLAASPLAERRVLLRRAHLALTGLPPNAEEVERFERDESPDAFERVVDQLLASPAYGERWGRHWLDVARYAEDNPTSESTCPPPRFAYRYRDWVIRALNADLPYDDFVRRQLAADLYELPPAELAALGFLGLSPVYHKEPKLSADVIATIAADEWDERVDTITRGFLGLTVACARCHDHKFDPIRTEDYYALAGVMASTQLVEWPLEPAPLDQAIALTDIQWRRIDANLRFDYAKRQRDTAKQQNQDLTAFEAAVAATEAEVKQLKETPLYEGPIANVVRDARLVINGADPTWTYLEYRANEGRDLPVFIRGNPLRPGATTPRRFLETLSPRGPAPFTAPGSGRRELAEAIVGDAGPLAARVFVNRVWTWHFGQGLVRTPSNFGELGERPSHPELLESLTARFVADGWSLKQLHRQIIGSATWRQSSRATAEAREVDPDNRYLARMSRRRLEPEAWRDSLLALAYQLDATPFGPSRSLDDDANWRRTIYASVSRQKLADLFKLFDFPDPKQHAETRQPTTTPLQHLYLLNSPLTQRIAERLAEQALAAAPSDDEACARELFRRILLRAPAAGELGDALELVAAPPPGAGSPEPLARWSLLAHALLTTNELLYVD